MSRWQLYALLGTAFALGALAIRFMPEVPQAAAQDEGEPEVAADDGDTDVLAVEEPAPIVVSAEGGRLVCRLFLVDVGDSDVLDTSDRTTEVGQWVGDQVDQGMSLHGVDFEVGQKTTGYPQGYVHVCVYPS